MDRELYLIFFFLLELWAFKIDTHTQEAKCLKKLLVMQT